MDLINALGEVGVDVVSCGTVWSGRPDPGVLRTQGGSALHGGGGP
ncbi:hypothetical protein ACIQCD_04970 [Streptomyces sp. NPDC093250]